MIDPFGRTIDYLRISVTDLCNYRCVYCMGEQGVRKLSHDDILTVEEIVGIAAQAVRCGIHKIRITGGEPLVRKGILPICEGISALDGIHELCLTTNGALLPQYAGALKKAGVDRLNISLDTLDPEKFKRITRIGTLADVLNGLEAAETAGFTRLKLNTVLIGGINEDEIRDFVALTRDRAMDVRFIELMPIGECAQWDTRHFLDAQAVLDACPDLVAADQDGVAETYRIPGYAGSVGLIRAMSRPFCRDCNRVRVTADGKLKPCLHSAAEIPIKGLRGEDLLAALRQGILQKPFRHHMDEHGSDSARDMHQIGG